MWPLMAIVSVLVLPTYRACSDDKMESAAEYAAHNATNAFWVLPVFVCAAVLALLTFRAARRKELDVGTRRMGLLSVGLFGGALVAAHAVEWVLLASAAVAFGAAVALTRSARGLKPWQIWEHQLGAYTLLAAATGPTIFLSSDLIRGGFDHLGVGAYVFLAAQLALWVILTPAIVRAHRPSAG